MTNQYLDINNIHFIISSNINYYKHSYFQLTNSLMNCGISRDNIFFVVGGAEKEEELSKNVFHTPINSFDFTSLIYMLHSNRIVENKVYFLLHDTVVIDEGPFKSNIQKIPNFAESALRLNVVTSMNIGFYRGSYLLENRNTIMQYYNIDSSPENLNVLKEKMILEEDVLLKGFPCLNYNRDDVFFKCDVKGNADKNGKYNKRYFAFPGISKIQRNFQGLTGNYIINY